MKEITLAETCKRLDVDPSMFNDDFTKLTLTEICEQLENNLVEKTINDEDWDLSALVEEAMKDIPPISREQAEQTKKLLNK